ncbi:MAG: hypothetical protein ACTSRS_14430 [Candidatus Helarchaeota archaeon]
MELEYHNGYLSKEGMLPLNLENIVETKKVIQRLMANLESEECNSNLIAELKGILEKIGSDPKLYSQYEDIYSDAADVLILAGVSAEDCKCDPLRKHTPVDKTIQ